MARARQLLSTLVKETHFSPGIEQFLDGVLGSESALPEEAVQDFLNWSGGWGPDETSDEDVAFWLSDNGERFGLANMDPDQFRASWKAAMNKTESLVAQLVHENTTRRIDTGLTGPVNGAILSSVMGQLSDGKWENTPQMSKYWRNADIVDEGGRLFIDVNDGWDSGFRGKDEKWIKTWFAGKIKEIVYDEMGGVQWNRSDNSEVSYLSRSGQPVTVSNAYQAYEILKGRNLRNRYAAPVAPAVPAAV